MTKELEAKREAISTMQKEMKKASELREGENAEFQETITDHRVTQVILGKAIDRMGQVYSLAQAGEPEKPGAPHVQLSGTATDPGNGPARFSEYAKSKTGGAVVEMLQKVLADSKSMENEALRAEQDAQALYENFMKDSNTAIKKYQGAIIDLSEAKAREEQALTLAEEDHVGTVKELESLHVQLGDLRSSCDFLLRNFDARQDARTTEIEALKEAKAILSGMK